MSTHDHCAFPLGWRIRSSSTLQHYQYSNNNTVMVIRSHSVRASFFFITLLLLLLLLLLFTYETYIPEVGGVLRMDGRRGDVFTDRRHRVRTRPAAKVQNDSRSNRESWHFHFPVGTPAFHVFDTISVIQKQYFRRVIRRRFAGNVHAEREKRFDSVEPVTILTNIWQIN